MVEKLLMPGVLKKYLALERVRSRVNNIISNFEENLTQDCITLRVETTSEFINLLYDLYESLPGSDVALKEPVCRRSAVSRVEEKFFKQLMPVMQKHGSLAI